MADNNYTVKSLKLYDANKVISAINIFHEHCSTFDTVAHQILCEKDNVMDHWKGAAANMFEEKFKTVYSQVTDIGDALYEIYNALLDAQDAFYQADDSLNQQMKQAQHNDSKSSGGSSSSSDSWSTLEVVPHNTPDAYVPNITYPPMKPIPVPQSTMGESYNPSFFYENFQNMPVIDHAVPSPYIVQMLYDSMTVKDIIAHNVGEATENTFEYDQMTLKEVVPHDVPDATVPELTYDEMAPKEVVPHNTPDPYVPEFTYDQMSPVDVGFHNTDEIRFNEFAYEGMTPHDVLAHNTEDAHIPELGYDAMERQEVVAHNTPDAYVPEFAYDAMERKEVVPHNTPEAYVPEFAYDAMFPEAVPQSTIGEAYFPTFMNLPMARKARLISSVSVSVINTMTKGMVEGTDAATLKLTLGNTVIDMLSPSSDMDDATRQQLALQLGDNLFNAICGSAEGSTLDVMNGLVDNTTSWTRENMNTAISAIMADVVMPGTTLTTISQDVAQADMSEIASTLTGLWTPGTTYTGKVSDLLGDAGTEGITGNNLSAGLSSVASFSMKMTTRRVLTDSTNKAFNDSVDVSALDIPVASCIPSLTETKVDCSDGTVTWTLTADAGSTVMNSAITQFSRNPNAISTESAQALKSDALSSLKVTNLKLPDLSARFI